LPRKPITVEGSLVEVRLSNKTIVKDNRERRTLRTALHARPL
jgi:hypothetical protein